MSGLPQLLTLDDLAAFHGAHASPCPACRGRGYVTEDPMPDCPSVTYVGTESECSKCEGTGEVAT